MSIKLLFSNMVLLMKLWLDQINLHWNDYDRRWFVHDLSTFKILDPRVKQRHEGKTPADPSAWTTLVILSLSDQD